MEHVAFETHLESRAVEFIFFSSEMEDPQMNIENDNIQSDWKRYQTQSSCKEMLDRICLKISFKKSFGT